MKIDENKLEILPINPLLAKEHMDFYREGRGYLDKYLNLEKDFHLLTFKDHASSLLLFYKNSEKSPVYMVKYGKKLVGVFIFIEPKFLGGIQIAYMIRKKYSGLGIASIALKHISDIAFYKFKYLHIELHIDIDNVGSKKVAEKCGFTVIDGYTDYPIGTKGSGNMEVFALVNNLPSQFVQQIPREDWMVNHEWTPGERNFLPRLPFRVNRRTRRIVRV